MLEEQASTLNIDMRRWQIQRIRRVINTLFYLRNFAEWGHKQPVFAAFPELVEQFALANALKTGTVNPILPFFGRGPAAFAELWSEHQPHHAHFELGNITSNVELDSLTTLRLYGQISDSSVNAIQENSHSRLLKATRDESPIARSNPDLSFTDEFESLRLGMQGTDIATLLRTKFSTMEGSVLEALSLHSSEYRS